KNLAIHQSELINFINRLGLFCQSLKLGQTHAILLCSLLVADKFFGSLLGFLNIFSCVSHDHFPFLPRIGIVRYWSSYFWIVGKYATTQGTAAARPFAWLPWFMHSAASTTCRPCARCGCSACL